MQTIDFELEGDYVELNMLLKLTGVVFLTVWHFYLGRARKAFAEGRNQRSERYWRMVNELPFIAAILMVLAVTTEFTFG